MSSVDWKLQTDTAHKKAFATASSEDAKLRMDAFRLLIQTAIIGNWSFKKFARHLDTISNFSAASKGVGE